MRETHGSAWMANRRRGCCDDLRRFDTQPREQVDDSGDRESGACSRLRPLVGAPEPAPATETREDVLDLVEGQSGVDAVVRLGGALMSSFI
jgi:hypothetical protein